MESIFFWVSKLAWLLIAPDTLILAMLLVAWLLLSRRAYRGASWLLGFTAVLLLCIALFPVGAWLLSPLELRFDANPALPDAVDGIVVLGGSEMPVATAYWHQAELNDAAERHLAMLSLARRYPEARLVYTGGSGSMLRQQFKEASVAERLYRDQLLDLSRLVFEEESRNTHENAVHAYDLVKPAPGETWILVTTASHMPRSVGVFCKLGWTMLPYPVDHRTVPGQGMVIDLNLAEHLRVLNHAVREWAGLAAYYLTGKTTSVVPQRCDRR